MKIDDSYGNEPISQTFDLNIVLNEIFDFKKLKRKK